MCVRARVYVECECACAYVCMDYVRVRSDDGAGIFPLLPCLHHKPTTYAYNSSISCTRERTASSEYISMW